MDVDLVLLALGGVQQFIVESRTTADVASSSVIMQRLAARAARAAVTHGFGQVELVYPVLGQDSQEDDQGVTNKIALLAPAGGGPQVAAVMSDAVTEGWRRLVSDCFGSGVDTPATPGMPDVWWVCVTGSREDYPGLWRRASELAVARHRARMFTALPDSAAGVWLCSQSSRLPSVPRPKQGVRRHERRERLSAAGWIKRTYQRRASATVTRSTASIASTSYRVRLLDNPPDGLAAQVGALRDAAAAVTDLVTEDAVASGIPGELVPLATQLGAWVYPQAWDLAGLRREYSDALDSEVVRAGHAAASAILRLSSAAGIRRPTLYYAVVLQDLDRLGRAMGRLGLGGQQQASAQLVALGRAQRQATLSAVFPGVPVYAGGDDFLAFCPAAGAARLARRIRDLVNVHLADGPLAGPDGGPVTASTAVVFAHMSYPLRMVMVQVREALEDAKNATDARLSARGNRDAIVMVALRRHGERTRSIQPWHHDPVSLWEALRPAHGELSGSLASQLEHDEPELTQLAERPELHATLEAELARLVLRRGGALDRSDAAEKAAALHRLAWAERAAPQPPGASRVSDAAGYRLAAPVLLARFLTQECG